MSESSNDLYENLSEGEYKLVSLQHLKSQIRASRLAIQNSLSKIPTPISDKPMGTTSSRQLQKKYHTQAATKGEDESGPVGSRNKFLLSSRKSIKDVLAGDQYNPTASSLNIGEEQPHEKQGISPNIYNDKVSRSNFDIQKIVYIEDIGSSKGSPKHSTRREVQEAQYFSKREGEQKNVSDVDKFIGKYSSSPTPYKQIESNPSASKMTNSRFATSNQMQHQQPQEQTSCKLEKDGKHCKLCELTHSHIKRAKQRKHPRPPPLPSPKQRRLQQPQEAGPVILNELRASKVNSSLGKSINQRYLSQQDKSQYQHGSFQVAERYLEPGLLKRQFLVGLASKNGAIDKQIKKLTSSLGNTPDKKSLFINTPGSEPQKQGSTRKKIFGNIQTPSGHPSPSNIRKPGYLTPSAKNSKVAYFKAQQKERSNHEFSPSKAEANSPSLHQNKAISRKVNFEQIRSGLTNSRIKQFRSKSRESSNSLPKKSMIPGLRLMEMPAEVRRWYEANRKQIVYQCDRIISNDLIKRYMGQQQLSGRLFKLVLAMMSPKRWLMLMIDQVYAKLKDRYLGSTQ